MFGYEESILSETVVIIIPELNMSAFGSGGRSMCQNMGLRRRDTSVDGKRRK